MKTAIEVEPVGIRIEDLKKSYGKQVVLDGLSLTVEPGQIFVLMGPSGSGKSVLLRQIIGLEKPDSGKILIEEADAGQSETHEKYRSAMVFQAGALFNSISVYDNLALYLREHRLYPEKTIREKVYSVMEALSLADSAKKIPAELSGGMRKRVAVARAIIMEPQLILYDEPTSELDPVLSATTCELIATVSRETGATSIVVTHDRDLALLVSDRVGLLLDGKLAFDGTREELKSVEDKRVREFMNPTIDLENPRFRKQEKTI